MTATDSTAAPDSTSVVRSSRVMALGTIASRATGFLRTAVIAAAIGTSVGDAYNLANTIPNIVYELLLGGVLTSVVVPLLVSAARREGDDGEAYGQRLLTMVTVALGGASLVAVLLAPWLIRLYSTFGTGLPAPETALATTFARFFLPQVLFYGIGALIGAILNSRGSFAAPMWAPVVNNVVVIVTGVVFLVITIGTPRAGDLDTVETLVLSIGTTAGIIAQTVALLPALRATGFRLRARWDWRGVGLREAGRLAAWVFVYVLANQAAFLVIINLASPVPFGISAYTYAFILVSLPHAIVAVSVITALLPRMSRSAVDGRLHDVAVDLARGLKLAGALLVPSQLALMAVGPLVATVVFAHFNLSTDSARFIGLVLAGYAVSLVPFSAFQMQLRAFYALHDTRTPALVNIGVNAVNLLADVALYAALDGRARIVGLAVGYSLSYFVGTAVFAMLLRRRIGAARQEQVQRTYVRLTVASVLGVGVGWLVAWAVTSAAGTGWPGALAGLVAGAVVGAPVFVTVASRMHVDEVRQLAASTRVRLGTTTQ